jgi:Barstar (barnase inhibitor)
MAVFQKKDLKQGAYWLMHNGPVNLFQSEDVLNDCIKDLEELKYSVHVVETIDLSVPKLIRALASTLDFPDFFTGNGSLDAFNDCMKDVIHGEYGWNSIDDAGLVIVLRHFDNFTNSNPQKAQMLIDILADCSRSAMLWGNRVIILLQVEDAEYRLEPLGATNARWNSKEIAYSSRKR